METRARWTLVSLLFVGGMISYLDRAALSITAPLISKELNLDPAQLGIVFSSFFVGYALFCFVGGYSADRWGPKVVLSVSMLVWSLFCGLTAATVGIVSLLLVRVIFGMGEGPFCANINKLVSNWYPRDQQASALGLANSGQSIGAAIAGPVVGFLALATSWRASFVIIGAAGVLWVVAWLWLAKERPSTPIVEPEQSRVRDAALSDESAEPAPLSTYLLRPAILATAFAFFGYAYILYFFLSWFPSYLTMAHHLSIQKMSIVSVIPWAVGVTGLVAGGYACDWLVRKTGRAIFSRKIVLITSLGAGAVCIGVTGTVTELTSAVALMAVAVFFMYASFNTYFAIVLDTVEKRRVGAVGGFVHFIANLAGIVAPALTGFLVQWSGNFKSAFVLTGIIAALGALFVAVFVRAPKAELQLQPELA
ncbi:MFS transporter [Burkholderia sp. SFA1]|uniref:MFS transporter n=1 Tax=Caballeronia sp. CLC5 TaxID=2906764 RepID=UPI00023883F4|nr:MFS transporter [Caballeronia sp. CLC5]AET92208.1 major facilitator superfamily [Burkholderia sp. YI23]MCE4573950.1 MFS transporter [Caballeronia sp. CLC5]BBQ00796.1 MFS transporter [Burkholderia sp. SFA1]